MSVCNPQHTGVTLGSGDAADCDFVLMSCQKMAMSISSLQPVKLEHLSFVSARLVSTKGISALPASL